MNAVLTIAEGAICPLATTAARLARERVAEIGREQGEPLSYRLECRESAMAGYRLTVQDTEIAIEAGKPREFIAAVGRLLELLRAGIAAGGGLASGCWEEKPRYPVRLHYLPGHFGNSFEVAWPGEMRRYLRSVKRPRP